MTEVERMLADLSDTCDELRRLLDAQDRTQEAERLRIAREVHEHLQQNLAAVLMDVGEARAAIAAAGAAWPGADAALTRIRQLSMQMIAATRRIIRDLRPQALEELGLEASLRALAATFAAHSGIPCRIDARGLDRANPGRLADVGICVYRVTQEALDNVAEHASARGVRITVHHRRDGLLRWAIADDGRGLAAGARDRRDAYGLLGMRERLRAVGGTLEIRSRPGRGTIVEATIPAPVRTVDRTAHRAPVRRQSRSTRTEPETSTATATTAATATAAPATPA